MNAQHLLNAVIAQRENMANQAAQAEAEKAELLDRIKELEERVAELEKP